MRARFVDADGVSFFEETGKCDAPIYLRPVYPDDDEPGGSFTDETTVPYLSVRIGVYRREYWHIPIGPLACPTYYGVDRFGEPRVWDVVYRFESWR